MTPDEFHDALHKDVGRPRTQVRTRLLGRLVVKDIVQEPGAHRAPWAFATINLGARLIKAQINLALKRGGLGQTRFDRLKHLVFSGIRRYWSRSIRIRDQVFHLDVNAIQNVGVGIEVGLSIERGESYARSNNIGILGIDAAFIYNEGFFATRLAADQDFMLTAAHELGHSILMEYGGIGRSWTHKGSTSIFQSTTSSTPGYPAAGEIDLMRYYEAEKNAVPTPFSRIARDSRASELDVKCLLWMSKLAF